MFLKILLILLYNIWSDIERGKEEEGTARYRIYKLLSPGDLYMGRQGGKLVVPATNQPARRAL